MSILNFINTIEWSMAGIRPSDGDIPFIRGEQVNAFKKLLPYGLAASAANALALIWFFLTTPHGATIWLWAVAIILVSVVGVRSGLASRRRRRQQTTAIKRELPARVLDKPFIESTILGLAWSLAPLLLLGEASEAQTTIILTICAGMMAGGAYMLSPIPRAASSFVLFLSLGVLGGIVTNGITQQEGVLVALLASYTIVMVRSIYWNFGNYVRSWTHQLQLSHQAEELSHQKELISVLLKDFQESVADCLWETDATGHIQNASERLAQFCNQSKSTLNHTPISDLVRKPEDGDNGDFRTIQRKIIRREGFADLLIPIVIDGKKRWWNITGKPIHDVTIFKGFRGVISDVTEARNAEHRIAYLAHNDTLTDLPNRQFYNQFLEGCFDDLRRNGHEFAILSIDLDSFKAINDVHGHDVGDAVLRHAAQSMKRCIRKGDIIARIGGDEFSIVLRHVRSKRSVMALGDKITDLFREPVIINGVMLKIGASVGIAFCPDDATTLTGLVKCADLALYRSKNLGRGMSITFDQDMDHEAQERRELESQLRLALHEQQFFLQYQPIVSSGTQEIIAFETLLRWQHPERGVISPEIFINMTEQTGMIVNIGEWIIRTALNEAATWVTDARISINLSPIQVRNPGIVSIVAQALAATGMPAGRVEFEITETVLIDDSQEALQRLRGLQALGVSIALDDFGTGYSSLSFLRSFPFDRIKIDKSFVHGMEKGSESRAIVDAITKLAQSLGMDTTAEGVETREQADQLIKTGCTALQGYYYYRPQSADALQNTGIIKLKSNERNNAPAPACHIKASPEKPSKRVA